MHEELGDFGPMTCVRQRRQPELHRSDDAIGLARDEQDHAPGLDVGRNRLPPGGGLARWERRDESHRGPALDGVGKERP